MESAVQQTPIETPAPTADVVGNAFVHQYYLILHQSPELVHRFYQDISKLGRPEENGFMSTTTTMQAINEKILSLDYGGFTAEITTVDAQESYNGGVLVLVTGYLMGKDNVRKNFTQSFFLAPQDKGYFVLNDVFRYVDDADHQNGNQDVSNGVKSPIIPKHDDSPIPENHVAEPTADLQEAVDGDEVYNPSENGEGSIGEEEAPAPEVVPEVPNDVEEVVVESSSKIEDVPKKSYASIVKVMKESVSPFSIHTPPLRSVTKIQEQQVTVAPPPPVPAAETTISSTYTNTNENGNLQEVEGEGHSIYVKGLPLNAIPSLLENEFKKFGAIKSGGIQVRSQKGFCFGFVEFEVAGSVQSAIEASPILINGRQVVVEEKRSTGRGNNRGRFSSGRGAGYRNEGGRGRGNYGGGRSYGRNDFNGRAEFGNKNSNRGGFSNRGGDGYNKSENMANNGGRDSHAAVGLAVNSAAKTTAPRVTATA